MEIGSKLRAAGAPISNWPLIWAAICRARSRSGPTRGRRRWPPRSTASTRFRPGDRRGLCPRGTTLLCHSLGPPQRILPLQTATKTATNGKFWGDPRNATALESRTYDSRAASRAERTGLEHPSKTREISAFFAQGAANSGAVADAAALAADLACIVAAWPMLPAPFAGPC